LDALWRADTKKNPPPPGGGVKKKKKGRGKKRKNTPPPPPPPKKKFTITKLPSKDGWSFFFFENVKKRGHGPFSLPSKSSVPDLLSLR